ncbi:TetR/AcrR family transcriptional regulator [Bosea sp. BH3]|uniref:TetR/AcrR family transcriptional regulator n=1 Tax=Bosea sp. BH3 TaxID=2871701 RepID=UPI0021CB0845|nr:TetR/AcrR family transcriptional regulator [Bosea sp. BH3]MCU4179936.1 TetR/AcrR family transcriptional regulator [Bosea sp. BH3]
MVTRIELVSRLERAFLDHGYDQVTMIGLAKAVDVTRRTLYNYFSSKEEAFRFLIENVNQQAVEAGMEAGRLALLEERDPVAVFAAILDTRYGHTRRRLATSPHAVEINDQAFRRCRDIMITSAVAFQAELAALIVEMQDRGLLRLKPKVRPEDLAQLLADGARGTNQSLPPIDPGRLHLRYANMVRALLYGAAEPAA